MASDRSPLRAPARECAVYGADFPRFVRRVSAARGWRGAARTNPSCAIIGGVQRLDISQSTSSLFGTILVAHDWPDSEELNGQLAELLLAKERSLARKGENRSNAGGWQSPGNLIGWTDAPVKELKQRIETIVFNLTDRIIRDRDRQRQFRLLIDAWGNINRNGDYNVVHTHPNCMWSGVYYVTRGNPDPSIPQNGLLELLDPREAANYLQIRNTILDGREFIENVPGRMLLWPSWMKHMVHPYTGSGERISIAYNVNVVEEAPDA
ncbi:MAG: hypothetical protein F4234_13450 [Gammaproteobacteria bacterium]|nr:hypothetical protein [Gammaproteobacteria bacterium]